MNTKIIIPARLESTRLPEKLIQDVNGKPLIRYAYESAKEIYWTEILTDSYKISDAFKGAAYNYWPCIVNETHNGTEKIKNYARENLVSDDIVIHWQADVPLMHSRYIYSLVDLIQHNYCDVATLVYQTRDVVKLCSENTVKVVTNNEGYVQYFSRERIPHKSYYSWIHTGIYCYRVKHLFENRRTIEHCYESEKLEQLDWLMNGSKILTVAIGYEQPVFNIDTQEDLDEFRNYISG